MVREVCNGRMPRGRILLKTFWLALRKLDAGLLLFKKGQNIMLIKLIIFLIRIKLGLKKEQKFQFVGQKSTMNVYYFTDTNIMKVDYQGKKKEVRPSSVSLTWLLSPECEIKICRNPEETLRKIKRMRF